MNDRMIERVARVICFSAGLEHSPDGKCAVCEGMDGSKCQMVSQFKREAIAAIKEIKR